MKLINGEAFSVNSVKHQDDITTDDISYLKDLNEYKENIELFKKLHISENNSKKRWANWKYWSWKNEMI